jgi:hypothetical protein
LAWGKGELTWSGPGLGQVRTGRARCWVGKGRVDGPAS